MDEYGGAAMAAAGMIAIALLVAEGSRRALRQRRHSTPGTEPTIFRVTLSGRTNARLEEHIRRSGCTKEVALEKAIRLYLASCEAKNGGDAVGIIDPATGTMKVEFKGL